MSRNAHIHSSGQVFFRQTVGEKGGISQHGLGQDNHAFPRVRIATAEPVAAETVLRTRPTSTPAHRVQKVRPKRRTVQVAAWVKPAIRSELERIAREEGLSLSRTIGTLLEEAVHQKLHVRHAVLMQPIIESAIRQQMRAISTRLASLLVRVAFDAGQTRSLVTNILGRQPGVNQEVLEAILDGSSKTARGNLARKTPQLTELIDLVEKWIATEERRGHELDQ
jgi:hypothetical protein